MAVWSVFLIALGVSADAFAVALGKGLHMRRLNYRSAIVIALTFGLFQAVMPLIGWLLGTQLQQYITAIDHWIAFGLLAVIGGKMLWDAFHDSGEDDESDDGRVHVRQLLLLAVATSVDALAVGISFAFLDVAIVQAVIVIGVTTAVLTFVGVLVGHRAGIRFRGPAEIVGGAILILIGTKILLDHLGVFG